jgi:hypothetical protein
LWELDEKFRKVEHLENYLKKFGKFWKPRQFKVRLTYCTLAGNVRKTEVIVDQRIENDPETCYLERKIEFGNSDPKLSNWENWIRNGKVSKEELEQDSDEKYDPTKEVESPQELVFMEAVVACSNEMRNISFPLVAVCFFPIYQDPKDRRLDLIALRGAQARILFEFFKKPDSKKKSTSKIPTAIYFGSQSWALVKLSKGSSALNWIKDKCDEDSFKKCSNKENIFWVSYSNLFPAFLRNRKNPKRRSLAAEKKRKTEDENEAAK